MKLGIYLPLVTILQRLAPRRGLPASANDS
jgi:hypothetical protein